MSDQILKSGYRWAGVREAAAYAACGKSKFWAMINQGNVLAVKNGRKVVVSLDSIDDFYRGLPRVGAKALTATDIGLAVASLGSGNLDDLSEAAAALAGESTALAGVRPPPPP